LQLFEDCPSTGELLLAFSDPSPPSILFILFILSIHVNFFRVFSVFSGGSSVAILIRLRVLYTFVFNPVLVPAAGLG